MISSFLYVFISRHHLWTVLDFIPFSRMLQRISFGFFTCFASNHKLPLVGVYPVFYILFVAVCVILDSLLWHLGHIPMPYTHATVRQHLIQLYANLTLILWFLNKLANLISSNLPVRLLFKVFIFKRKCIRMYCHGNFSGAPLYLRFF